VLDNRKQIFEELLWEHHGISEAFSSLKLEHSQCQGLLEPPASFVPAFAFVKFLPSNSFCVALLPEASSKDLAAQVAALKSKPR
jgi:hypothetical protein